MSASAPRRGVLVDWGGVLTTSPYASFEEFAAAEGLAPGSMRPALARGGALHDLFVALEKGTVADDVFERDCAAALGLQPDRVEGLRERLFAGMRRDHAVRRAIWALRRLGVRTGLLSNSVGTGGYDQETMDELFDVAVISRDVGMRKPDPAIYAFAVERMELEPHELVFVDDLKANLVPAHALGIATVLHRDATTTTAELERLLGHRLPGSPG